MKLKLFNVIAVGSMLAAGYAYGECIQLPISGKIYNIVNKGSGKYLDVSGASKDNGANILQWSGNAQVNQQFTLTKLENNNWSIRPVHSDKSLDVWGFSKDNGGTIKQYEYTGTTNQQWQLKESSSGGIKVSSAFSGKLLSVANANQGSDVYQDQDKASLNQVWNFNPIDGSCKGFTLEGNAGDGEVSLKWNTIAGVSSLQVYIDTDSNPSGRGRLAILNGDATSYKASGLNNGTTYWFWVKYRTSDGSWQNSNAFSATPKSSNTTVSTPNGFGATTTGGRGGQVVRVSTMKELEYALCHTQSGGACTDKEARIIEVQGTIDFRTSAGNNWKKGCDYGKACSSPYITEKLVLLNDQDTHCDGKNTFDIAYDKAADTPLLIGSNKTVVGIGSDATIKGKELRLYNVSNVIVQNLTISDINEGIIFAGDGMLLYNADRIWIDHNRFERIGRHFITGGYGSVTNTTISWNDFNGNSLASNNCDGIHYWNVMLVGETQSITMANNWFREFSGRAPKISGNTTMQMVNNYFEHGTWHALDVSSESNSVSKVLVEGNYFENVDTPITKDSNYVFAVNGEPSASIQATCKNALGRNCVGNILTKTPSVNRFVQQNEVMNAFKNVSSSAIAPKNANEVPTMVKNGAGPGHL